MSQETLFFYNKKGQRIGAKAYIPVNGKEKHPAVIFSHGFGGNYKSMEQHAEYYNDLGLVCIFYDFCGGGEDSSSEGTMLEMTVLTEVDDLLSVIDSVSNLPYVDADKISLQGESQGGFVSAYVAAQIPERITSLVLWYPAFVIPDDSKKRFENNDNTCFGHDLCPNYNIDSKDIDIFSVISAYKGPVKIIHGDKDGIVPYNYSERAHEAYLNSDLIILPGADHGYADKDNIFARESSANFIQSFSF